jgi:hypothetical protein
MNDLNLQNPEFCRYIATANYFPSEGVIDVGLFLTVFDYHSGEQRPDLWVPLMTTSPPYTSKQIWRQRFALKTIFISFKCLEKYTIRKRNGTIFRNF